MTRITLAVGMDRRLIGRLDPATAPRLLGAITTGTFGDLKVRAWLRLLGASEASQRPQGVA